jgi:hypothetical protein
MNGTLGLLSHQWIYHRMKNKELLATLAICTAMIGFLSIGLSANAQPNKSTKPESTSPKPNFVYIVADDLGWKDVGFHGPTLPSSVELYNIPQDPSEKNNVAAEHPEIVAGLQKRAQELAAAGVKPLFMEEGFGQIVRWSHLPPAFPCEEFEFDQEQ